jgi:predicted nucleotidyltransferase
MSAALDETELKTRIAPIASRHGVRRVYLFGSRARGDARSDSDIDLCIEKGSIRTLLDLSGFYMDLQETFGCPIDVVTTDSIDGDFKSAIEKDFVEIYGPH